LTVSGTHESDTDTVRDIALSRSFVSESGQTILSRDNGVFLNHSERPNIAGESSDAFALRDIEMDEELTEDYRLLPLGACRAFLGEPSQIPPPSIMQTSMAFMLSGRL
jgi:hypothetical protein